VVYVSDHGEMNGEHGMWRKSNFYEYSSRVPLVMARPGHLAEGRRIQEVVSLVDLTATLVDIADGSPITPLDGDSLLPLARGEAVGWKDEAFAEYPAHGVAGPMAMLRRGHFKLNYSLGDEVELYDLVDDPGEFRNLADRAEYADTVQELTSRLLSHWDPVDLKERVIRSQKERLLIEMATTGQDPTEQRRRWTEAGSALRPPS
jgi:choline-sulfatase